MSKLSKWFFISILLSVFFLLSTNSIKEGDLFWHIKTGEWIWEHKAIPSEDPFTFTAQKEDPARPHFMRYDIIMKGYWLGQPILYSIYHFFGIPGIVIFRAFIIIFLLLILYLWMRKLRVGFETSLIFIFLVGFYMMSAGDRPHYFSFLYFSVTAILLESLRQEYAKKESRLKTGALSIAFSLPLLMLIWANTHGGYITGVALIFIYLVGGFLRFKDGSVPWRFIMLLCAAMFVTFLNPNTYKIFIEVWHEEIKGGVRWEFFVLEMASPWKAAVIYGDYKPTYWIVLIIAAIVLVFRIKDMCIERIGSLVIFGAASLMVQRMIPFFLALTPIIALELEEVLRMRFKQAVKITAYATIFLALFLMVLLRNNIFDFTLDKVFPVKAVKFFKEERPLGNLFNYADWGGYIIMYLPEYKVFADGRRLMYDIEIAHYSIMTGSGVTVTGKPGWKAFLETYDMDIILIPSVNPYTGGFYRLVASLYKDPDWNLVYSDRISLIYLRKGRYNDEIIKKRSIPKELSLIQAINGLHPYKTEAERITNIKLIGDLYTLMGRAETAKQYYKLLEKNSAIE